MISYQDMIGLSDFCNELIMVHKCFMKLLVDQEIEDKSVREVALHLVDHLLREQEAVLNGMYAKVESLRDQDLREKYPCLSVSPCGMDPYMDTSED